jgi:hypothetical protein
MGLLMAEVQSVGAVLRGLAADPWNRLVRRWNWKSALTSAFIRAMIFFFANLSAGGNAAAGAGAAEFAWRFAVAGFFGSVIQSLRKAEPAWKATLVTSVALPVLNHTIEFLVHWLRGTPKLKTSIIASVCFTALAMLFNTYAMRRGVMITGSEGKSLGADLKSMPRVVAGFVLWMLRIQRSPQSL